MANEPPSELKDHALRKRGVSNPRADHVRDPLFREDPFFDPTDLVQVKYEMLRRVRRQGRRITEACAAFGFSRPAFYQLQAAFEREGLSGLLPKRRGPRAAHKLTAEVLAFVEQLRGEDKTLGWTELAQRIEQRFEVRVHPRSIERALLRTKKKR